MLYQALLYNAVINTYIEMYFGKTCVVGACTIHMVLCTSTYRPVFKTLGVEQADKNTSYSLMRIKPTTIVFIDTRCAAAL